jgi:cytochrome c553
VWPLLQAITATAALIWPTVLMAQSPPRFIMACAPCHGFDGMGHDPSIPNLAGQNATYLYNQVMAFRSAARQHPEMNFFSGQMTQREIEEIVQYYAKLPR